MADPEVLQADYRRMLMERKELASSLRNLRENVKTVRKDFDKTEEDLKALPSVGQIIGEVLRQVDSERLIVKASSGSRYVLRCRNKVDKEKLVAGTPVALDMTSGTLTIMRALPRETNVSSTKMDQPLSRDNKPNQGADFVKRDKEAFKQASPTRRLPSDDWLTRDVYSFGMVCYELVTGYFDGIAREKRHAIRTKLLSEERCVKELFPPPAPPAPATSEGKWWAKSHACQRRSRTRR